MAGWQTVARTPWESKEKQSIAAHHETIIIVPNSSLACSQKQKHLHFTQQNVLSNQHAGHRAIATTVVGCDTCLPIPGLRSVEG